MNHNDPAAMWLLCQVDTPGAEEVNGYPKGRAYIVKKSFPAEDILRCRRQAWNLLYAADGMDEEFYTDTYVVSQDGALLGHYVAGTVLWYADFSEGGEHETSYRRVKGHLVRLGFSRW